MMNIDEIINSEFRREMEQNGEIKSFPAGSVILNVDSYAHYIPLVLSGSIKVIRTEEDGREILLYYITPGESCIVSILAGMRMRQDKSKVKAVIEEDAEILMLSQQKAKEWIKNIQNGRISFLVYITNALRSF